MALLSAFIIPIGALVAGDDLAALALECRTATDAHTDAWQEAYAEVRGYLGKGSVSAVRPDRQPEPNGQNGSVKSCVTAYLNANPSLNALSVNQVVVTLKTTGIQAGRTTVAEVLQERRAKNDETSL